MRLDVVTQIDPYEKIGSVVVADAHYRSGDVARVFVKEYSYASTSGKNSGTVIIPTANVEVTAFAHGEQRWIAVVTDKPMEWWREIRDFTEMEKESQ